MGGSWLLYSHYPMQFPFSYGFPMVFLWLYSDYFRIARTTGGHWLLRLPLGRELRYRRRALGGLQMLRIADHWAGTSTELPYKAWNRASCGWEQLVDVVSLCWVSEDLELSQKNRHALAVQGFIAMFRLSTDHFQTHTIGHWQQWIIVGDEQLSQASRDAQFWAWVAGWGIWSKSSSKSLQWWLPPLWRRWIFRTKNQWLELGPPQTISESRCPLFHKSVKKMKKDETGSMHHYLGRFFWIVCCYRHFDIFWELVWFNLYKTDEGSNPESPDLSLRTICVCWVSEKKLDVSPPGFSHVTLLFYGQRISGS